MAHAELGVHRLSQLFHEAVVDAALDQEAVGAHAGLQEEEALIQDPVLDWKHEDVNPSHLSRVPEL